MSISIIFPIEVTGPSIPHPRLEDMRQQTNGFGATSYPDWEQVSAIKQNLKMMLLTRQGEYVMEPNFGIGLPDYIFMMEQEISTSSLESKIRSQAAQYMPYMTITDMAIEVDSLSQILRIRIEFHYNELSIPEVFELEVN